MLEAGKQFRRVNGHLHLPALRDALVRHVAGQTVAPDPLVRTTDHCTNLTPTEGLNSLGAAHSLSGLDQTPEPIRRRQPVSFTSEAYATSTLPWGHPFRLSRFPVSIQMFSGHVLFGRSRPDWRERDS